MSRIEWTEQTWNPIVGCSKVSPGCDNCYAEKMSQRLARMGSTENMEAYTSAIDWSNFDVPLGWSGNTVFVESALKKPLKRKKPTVYFVCSMSDLFHEDTPFEWIDKVFDVMANCPQHTFQVLTKRPARMMEYFAKWKTFPDMRLTNVWLGVTAENQEQADRRIPFLLRIPGAAVRFVSVEPMLGPVELKLETGTLKPETGLDWVICGCESGPGRRPMHWSWAKSLADQCHSAGVAFFMKQMVRDGKVVKALPGLRPGLRIREFPELKGGAE